MNDIEEIEKNYLSAISSAASFEGLEQIRLNALGKKGDVTALMKSIGSMEEYERKIKAPILNDLKTRIIEELEKKKTQNFSSV